MSFRNLHNSIFFFMIDFLELKEKKYRLSILILKQKPCYYIESIPLNILEILEDRKFFYSFCDTFSHITFFLITGKKNAGGLFFQKTKALKYCLNNL